MYAVNMHAMWQGYSQRYRTKDQYAKSGWFNEDLRICDLMGAADYILRSH